MPPIRLACLGVLLAPLAALAQPASTASFGALMPALRPPSPPPAWEGTMLEPSEGPWTRRLRVASPVGFVFGIEEEVLGRHRLSASAMREAFGPQAARGPGLYRALAGAALLSGTDAALPVRLDARAGVIVVNNDPRWGREARLAGGVTAGLDLVLAAPVGHGGATLAAFARGDWLPIGAGHRGDDGRLGPGWIVSAGLRFSVPLR